jgi:hypothetical protein
MAVSPLVCNLTAPDFAARRVALTAILRGRGHEELAE